MGSRGQYAASNRFSLYFEPKYRKVDEICGVKVLELKSGSGNINLPEYAKTSTAYIGIDKAGKFMRLRIYKDHHPVIDIDFGHPNHHGLKDGDIHVHRYGVDKDGHPVRSRKSRGMLPSEHEKYDTIIAEMKRRNAE